MLNKKELEEKINNLTEQLTEADKQINELNSTKAKDIETKFAELVKTYSEDETTKEQIGIMIEDLKKTYQTSQVDSLLGTIKSLSPRGSYDIEGAHDGLHLDHYAKCCAPLREASGLIVEHCYEVCFDREPTDDELYELEQELMRKKENSSKII